jgi:hypothetical protein
MRIALFLSSFAFAVLLLCSPTLSLQEDPNPVPFSQVAVEK